LTKSRGFDYKRNAGELSAEIILYDGAVILFIAYVLATAYVRTNMYKPARHRSRAAQNNLALQLMHFLARFAFVGALLLSFANGAR